MTIPVAAPVRWLEQHQQAVAAAVAGDPLLGRRVTKAEYEQVVNEALDLGFEQIHVQEVDDRALKPDFDLEKPFAWESMGGGDNA